ncbi:MAG: hypothetical protein DKT66_03750 [Candidatus Melainabacteria bacterium]|nr:MAG: hypothetical protein DKT66_03750 [Candidatus Melainabacteria bacterium]
MDEGYYLLQAKYPQSYPSCTAYQVFLAAIPRFAESRVLDFRYSQLFVQLIGGLLLAIGSIRWLSSYGLLTNLSSRVLAVSLCLMGNLFFFGKFPSSISYNSLTGFIQFASIGILLLAAIYENNFSAHRFFIRALLVFAGVITGWNLLIKFSAFVCFIPIAFLTLAVFFGNKRLHCALVYGLSILLGIVVSLSWLQNPAEWLTATIDWFTLGAKTHALHNRILTTYATNIAATISYFQPELAIADAALLSLGVVLSFAKRRLSNQKWLPLCSTLHLSAWSLLSWWLIRKNCLLHGLHSASVFYVIALGLLAELAGFLIAERKAIRFTRIQSGMILVGVLLATLPFTCSAGTSNPLLYQGTIYNGAWFLFLYYLSLVLARSYGSVIPILTTTTLICLFAVFQFRDTLLNNSYDVGSLKAQTTRVALPSLRGMKVTPEMARFLESTQSLLVQNGFQSGDPILAFYNLPGVIYALDGNSPGSAWYINLHFYRPWNQRNLSRIRLEPTSRLFLLVGFQIDKETIQALNTAGLKFPQDFEKVGSVQNPNKNVFLSLPGVADEPKNEFLDGNVDVYALKRREKPKRLPL